MANFSDFIRTPYGEDEDGINPFGSGTLAQTAAVPGVKKKKAGGGTPMWQDALAGALGQGGGSGLLGAGTNMLKSYALKKVAGNTAAKFLLGFL